MIATVTGRLAQTGLDWVVLEVGGVGVRLSVPPSTVSELASRLGDDPVRLSTTLVVREDSLTLYGFSSDEDRDTFDVLLSVSGIGPRTALAALSVLRPHELADAVTRQDLAVLQRIPGVGKKSASRMVLEIGGKLAALEDDQGSARASDSAGYRNEVEAALEQLGWTKAVAAKTLDKLEGDYKDASSLLRAALIQLGSTRG